MNMATFLKSYRSHLKVTLFVFVIFISWNIISVMIHGKDEWYLKQTSCEKSEGTLRQLMELTFIMHDVLQSLGVAHAVCYGTLWGVLRSGKLLSWDDNIDMCVVSQEIHKIDLEQLQKVFKEKGVLISYSSSLGHYELTYHQTENGYATVNGYLNIFDKDNSLFGYDTYLKRNGWNNFLFFSNNERSVPSHLLQAPFPTLKFYDKEIPVPRGDIEILKSFYPYNWWMEVKPLACL